MALPAFISDEDMMSYEQAQMPQAQGSVRFEPQPADGAPTIPQAPQVGFISDEQMDQMEAAQQPSMIDSVRQNTAGMLGSIGQGVTLGLADEAAAGIRSILPGYQDYSSELEAIRGGQKKFDSENPIISALGNIAGGVALPLGGVSKAATLGGKMKDAAKIGAVLGGMYGFGTGEGGLENRATNAATNAATSAALSPVAVGAISGLGKIAEKASKGADSIAKGFAQDAFGVRPAAIAKNLERGAVYLDDAGNQVSAANATDFTSQLEQKIARLQESPVFQELSNSPKKAYQQIASNIDDLNQAKNVIVDAIDNKLAQQQAAFKIKAKLKPDWSFAEDYIKSGKGSAGNKSTLASQLESLKQDWASKAGTFAELIGFKSEVDTGRVFANGPVDAASVKLREAVLKGIKVSAEKTADSVMGKPGEFKGINSQIADLLSIKDFLGKKAAKGGGAAGRALSNVASIKNLLVALGGGASGFGAPTAAFLAKEGLEAAYPATTSRNFSRLSNALSEIGDKASSSSVTGKISSAISSAKKTYKTEGTVPEKPISKLKSPSLKPTNLQQDSKAESSEYRKLAEKLAPAIAVGENSGDRAVSPKGAMGKMQLMPEIVKAFDVKDPFDPSQSLEGGIKLLTEELQRFRSVPLAVMAYNAGSPAVNRAIKKAGSKDPQKVIQHLPLETRKYLPAVLKALEAMS